MRINLKLLGLIIASFIMIVIMILIAKPRDLVASLQEVDLFIILVVICLYLINLMVKSARWFVLVKNSTDSTKVPFRRIMPYFLIGLALNNITPGRVGGDPVRAYILKTKEGISMGHGLSSVFIEKIADLFILAILALIGVILLFPYLGDFVILQFLIAIAIVLAGIVFLVYAVLRTSLIERFAGSFLRLTKKLKKSKGESKAEAALNFFVLRFKEGVGEIMKARQGILITLSLTTFIWINEAIRLYLILLALGINHLPSLAMVIIVSSMATLFGSLLIWGTGNAVIITAVFATVGLSISDATAAAFLMIMTSIWLSVILGVGIMLITTGRTLFPSKESDESSVFVQRKAVMGSNLQEGFSSSDPLPNGLNGDLIEKQEPTQNTVGGTNAKPLADGDD